MKLLDSSIWLAHLLEANSDCINIVSNEGTLLCSILSIYEIKKKLIKSKLWNNKKIEESIKFIKNRSVIINLNEDIINKAVEISIKNDLSSVDALIYSSALQNKCKFITADNDFRSLESVEVIEK